MASPDPSFKAIKYLPTKEAYDRWAAVYDTDGNFLQAMDDIEMQALLPRFESALQMSKPWKLVDLGCGTGRNTALLLGVNGAQVIALDASEGMLAVAKKRLHELQSGLMAAGALGEAGHKAHLQLAVFDLLASDEPPASATDADGVISTLVLEHIPLETFFRQASRLLKPGGVLLLTNMHAHMGGISQAGFVDMESGEKIRPTSYAHTVTDTIEEARKWGLVVDGEQGILERQVTEDLVETLGPRSHKWVGVTCWFGGLFRKSW
ncbi:hypothetical protein JX265_009087 [Neoarthrinium moseri]|uniref:Methyltransferase type 11 domain-containing protein n=1 Tax=Neoarthrinium moseri TaxID=1658444 RepID=A0A9P9WHD1_9PEZI|nr:hypothetical protein JX266_007182 [Neoarthrinium moseri]KAI1863041.1 hypothetical protein JX265_009087 [Neoarthrinium moseri]